MAKSDFCFTYYDGDAARDMSHMTRLERGCYTDIIISQRKFGRLTLTQIKKILSKDFDECWESIELVLLKDEDDKYYIEWLANSVEKMQRQSKKQSENVSKRGLVKPNSNLDEPKLNFDDPLGNGNEDEYGNDIVDKSEKEKAENFFAEKGIAPMMVNVFQSIHPNYPKDQEKDFSSCLEIAYKIAESNGWTKNQVLDEKRMEAVKFWEQIVHFSAADKWFCTRSISDLNKEWQRLIQTINNARTPTNGKQNSAINGQQLNEAHFKRFGNR